MKIEHNAKSVRELIERDFPAQQQLLLELLEDVEAMYRGELLNRQPCQVPYHDVRHIYAVFTVAMQIMLGDCRRRGQRCDGLAVRVLACAALFHDSGYLKPVGVVGGRGGQYTFEHVEISKRLARQYLAGKPDWTNDQCHLVAQLIDATRLGVTDELAEIAAPYSGLDGMLASADLLAQVSAENYIDSLPLLYEEFAEAYAWHGLERLRAAGFVVFDSYAHLLGSSAAFIRHSVLPRLEKMGNHELSLQKYFGCSSSPYMRQLRANLAQLDTMAVPATCS